MCTHGRPVRVPCADCADSYLRLIKIDTVEPITWLAELSAEVAHA